jgi:hypothetical protein
MTGDKMNRFAFVVDGEVAGITSLPEMVDDGELPESTTKALAIFRSRPIIVEITDDLVEEGFLWDGNSFTPPVE